jgi:formamidopyrimidine-DNA glycosylase
VIQLPEVEVIRKNLERDLVGKRVKDVTVKTPSIVGRHRNRPEFVHALQGHKIEGVQRRGTALVLELDGDAVLVVRPGPQSTLTRETATEPPGRHTQVAMTFTTGGALHYADPGKEGELFIVPVGELGTVKELQLAGIDPLADTFTWPAFSQRLKDARTPLKDLLCDPSFIVGLGDLYSDEILWAAGLSAGRGSDTLSSQEVRRLYRAVLEVLHESVKQRGSGEERDVDDPFAEPEEYGAHIKVYGREGEPCARCRQPIKREKVTKRSDSYFCAQCQT